MSKNLKYVDVFGSLNLNKDITNIKFIPDKNNEIPNPLVNTVKYTIEADKKTIVITVPQKYMTFMDLILK